jgi:predicted ATP-dependent protease
MIPKANERHLMLNDEVMEAVAAGRFHVWSVETIEQGIEILTGMKAGQRDKHGAFPRKTVFQLVDKRLAEMAERMQEQEGRRSRKPRKTATDGTK